MPVHILRYASLALLDQRTSVKSRYRWQVGSTVSYEEYFDPAKGKRVAKNVATMSGGALKCFQSMCSPAQNPCCRGGACSLCESA